MLHDLETDIEEKVKQRKGGVFYCIVIYLMYEQFRFHMGHLRMGFNKYIEINTAAYMRGMSTVIMRRQAKSKVKITKPLCRATFVNGALHVIKNDSAPV
jgi:hypothetical protein